MRLLGTVLLMTFCGTLVLALALLILGIIIMMTSLAFSVF